MTNKYFSYICALLLCASCGDAHQHNHHDHDGHNHESHEHAHNHDAHEHNHEHDAHEHAHNHDTHTHNHETKQEGHSHDEIVFEHSKAERFGVKSEKVTPSSFNSVIKVSGEVISAQGDTYIVSAPSSGIVRFNRNISAGCKISAGASVCSISAEKMVGGDSNEAARISYETAKKEYDRIAPLYRDKIVSEREYNAAREVYETARLAYLGSEGNGTKATSAISGTIIGLNVSDGEYVQAGTQIATVCKNAKLQLHADVPQRYFKQVASIVTANFKTSYSDDIVSLSSLNGKRISASNIAAAQGYIPVVFEFDNNNTLASGTYAEVYLISSTKKDAVTVPVGAIIEELDKYFVFVKLDENCYEKRLVSIGDSDGVRIEILSGLHAGEEVVGEGAIFVKLASNAGAIPEGHSHNH